MAVYGDIEGRVDDRCPLGAGGGWYAEAKREAEGVLLAAATADLGVVAMRPGCVYGPRCHLWVERFGRWLRSGRIGDLGAAATAGATLCMWTMWRRRVVAALRSQLVDGDQTLVANLAAPDSPRWNAYLVGTGPVDRRHAGAARA